MYVYGIWVYEVLGISKGYYKVKKSLVSWNEVHGNMFSPLFEKQNPRTKHPREVVK